MKKGTTCGPGSYQAEVSIVEQHHDVCGVRHAEGGQVHVHAGEGEVGAGHGEQWGSGVAAVDERVGERDLGDGVRRWRRTGRVALGLANAPIFSSTRKKLHSNANPDGFFF